MKRFFLSSILIYCLIVLSGCTDKIITENTVYVVNENENHKDLAIKISQIDIDSDDLEDITRILGEPVKYIWGKNILNKEKLPDLYIMVYAESFHIFMANNRVAELRFYDSSFLVNNSLNVGLKLDEVIKVMGEPKKVELGKECGFEEGILYKDILGDKGLCYYQRLDKNVRIFFRNYKVSALYYTSSDFIEILYGKQVRDEKEKLNK